MPMAEEKRNMRYFLQGLMRQGASWHETNALDDYTKRKDLCFDFLIRLYFRDAKEFSLLRRHLPVLLKRNRGEEWVLACAGYVAYLGQDYEAACRWFLKAIEANPVNLDNWMDLAFALRHAGDAETSTGILFNFDYVLYYARTFGLPGRGLAGLSAFVRKIVRASEKKR